MTDIVENLAKVLHESGREAVANRQIYRDDLPIKPFVDWEDLPEPAREGRRSAARFLIGQGSYLTNLLRHAAELAG